MWHRVSMRANTVSHVLTSFFHSHTNALVMRVFRYTSMNKRRPMLTQSLTAGVIGVIGDVLMQRLELRWARDEAAAAAAAASACGGGAADANASVGNTYHNGSTSRAGGRSIETISSSPSDSFTKSTSVNHDGVEGVRGESRRVDGSGGDGNHGEMNYRRTANMVVYRTLVFGPIFSTFIRRLEMAVPWTGWRGVAAKVAVDQIIFQPPMLMIFYGSLATLEGRPLRDAVDRAEKMLLPTLQLNVPFWTTVHCLTFSVIPVQYRVAWVSLIQCGWSAVMSGLNQRAAIGKPPLPLGVEAVVAA